MAANFNQAPHFPEPGPGFSASFLDAPTSEGPAAFYVLDHSPAQSSHSLNTTVPRSRRTPSPLPSPLLSPITSPYPYPLNPSFPVAPGQDTQPSPSYYYSQEPDVPQSQSHSVATGPTQIHAVYHPAAYQNNQGGSGDRMYEAALAMHDGHLHPRGPPSKPVVGNDASGSGWGLFRRAQRRTTKPPPQQPEFPSDPCRLPGCNALVISDPRARLGGFCGDTHMKTAINNGLAVQCPRCQWVVPAGSSYCIVCPPGY